MQVFSILSTGFFLFLSLYAIHVRLCLCLFVWLCVCEVAFMYSVVSRVLWCALICMTMMIRLCIYVCEHLGFMHVGIASSIQVDYIHVWNFNLNFGVVPVFILRICDFVHTITEQYIAARDIVLFFVVVYCFLLPFSKKQRSQNEREFRMQTPFHLGHTYCRISMKITGSEWDLFGLQVQKPLRNILCGLWHWFIRETEKRKKKP